MITQHPIIITPIGDKQPIAAGVFNSSTFEVLLSASSLGTRVRGDILPATTAPKYLDTVARMNLSLTTGADGVVEVNPMVGLAVAVGNHSQLEDYLDSKALSKSYADAYRLIFARAMVEVLNPPATVESASAPVQVSGLQQATTEAVVLEPVFVYVVEGFLGVVSLCTIALLVLTLKRQRNLRSSPGSIASVMSLTVDCQSLLCDFQGLDCCTADKINGIVGQKRYKLIHDGTHTAIIEVARNADNADGPQSPMLAHTRQHTSEIAKPVRPFEFSLWVAFPLVSLFVSLVISLAIIFVKAHKQGLPLPSEDSFVQNILENYIPTAIATMIEPIWILINRLLCLLQPLEELQGCNAPAKRSIDLDYSSLPPQLIVVKASRTKHFVLAAVCTMGLLANVLAVAFAGIFRQDTIEIGRPITLFSSLDLRFVSIEGKFGPDTSTKYQDSKNASGAYAGGDGLDQFLILESNYTRGTPLPAWTDEKLFYLPFFSEPPMSQDGSTYEAVTRTFGAELDCRELRIGDSFQAELRMTGDYFPLIYASMNINITRGSSKVQCNSIDEFPLEDRPFGNPCVSGPSAAEVIVTLKPRRENATQLEVETCAESVVVGWLRNPNKPCEQKTGQPLTSMNSTFVHCTPTWITGTARIRVDANGRLTTKAGALNSKRATDANDTTDAFKDIFGNAPTNLASQSNKYLLRQDTRGWHSDPFADQFLSYFMIRASNNTDIVSPLKSAPAVDAIMPPLKKAYSNLFAIWLGLNKDQLLLLNEATHQDGPKQVQTDGVQFRPETRLFVSTPMFIMSEVILSIYAIVAVMVYIRRPGQYLPCMPVNIASVIALFAASSAVQDLSHTSHLDGKGRARHLAALDSRYGYGSFVGGGDGRVHIGIEKTPFVRQRSRKTWLEKKVPLLRKTGAES